MTCFAASELRWGDAGLPVSLSAVSVETPALTKQSIRHDAIAQLDPIDDIHAAHDTT